jgi:hypothetical protein
MLVEVKFAVDRVCAVNEDCYKVGDTLLDQFIDAYLHCMAALSTLWQELADFVFAKFSKRT